MNQNKILLVEDDKNISFTISIYLESSGYKVVNALNGEEAIFVLKKNPDTSLVITDINMPVLNGIEFCKYIRTLPEYKSLPVLILTASTDVTTKYIGFNAGTDDYLTKPFDPIELLLRIQALLRRKDWQPEISDPENISTNIDEKIFTDTNLEINGKKVYFTSKEFDIFYYLFINHGKYVTSEELLKNVMDYPARSGNPEVIRTHMKNIRAKVEQDQHDPQIIKTSPRRGYFMDRSKIN